jgi:23S rRNA (uracil-5-)-methyltransferase RumA
MQTREPEGGAPPVVPGAVHRVEILRRDGRGRGIARLGRRELRVANALPGEVVDVRLAHVGRHVAEGRLVAVGTASPARIEDLCPHGTMCPGCGLRTTRRDDRLAFKRERLVEALSAAGLDASVVEPCVPAPAEDGARWKAYLVPRKTREGIVLGLYAEHSHRLVEVPGCPAHAAPVEEVLDAVRKALGAIGPSIHDERKRDGWLRGVAVRASSATGQALVVLVVARPDGGSARRLAGEIRRRSPRVAGVVANLHEEPGNAPFGPDFETVSGHGEIEEDSGPFRLRVSAGSFFQVNPAAGALLLDRLEREAARAPAGPALDLYGGVGATALRLAAAGREVTLVEAAPSAASDAEENVRRLGAGRVTVVRSRVERALPGALAVGPELVVVNPPRGGLSPAVRERLAAAPGSTVLYVSCDPASLARDATEIVASGRRLASVIPFDLMPMTPHVEALAVFVPQT